MPQGPWGSLPWPLTTCDAVWGGVAKKGARTLVASCAGVRSVQAGADGLDSRFAIGEPFGARSWAGCACGVALFMHGEALLALNPRPPPLPRVWEGPLPRRSDWDSKFTL